MRRQAPRARLTVQLDESLLGQVTAGVLPTFSGYSRIPAVERTTLLEGLRPVVSAVRSAGARSVVHVGSAWVGVAPAVLADVGAQEIPVQAVGVGAAVLELSRAPREAAIRRL